MKLKIGKVFEGRVCGFDENPLALRDKGK